MTNEKMEELGNFLNILKNHEEVIISLSNVGETHYSTQEIYEMLEPFYTYEKCFRVPQEEVQIAIDFFNDEKNELQYGDDEVDASYDYARRDALDLAITALKRMQEVQ